MSWHIGEKTAVTRVGSNEKQKGLLGCCGLLTHWG